MKLLPVILFVDDVQISIKFCELLITKRLEFDCHFFYATNGKEAVDFCKSNSVDLIFMNLQMPVMNGFEATRIIKKQNPLIPILAHSAYEYNLIKDEFLESGFDDFIKIPITEEKLKKAIDKYLT